MGCVVTRRAHEAESSWAGAGRLQCCEPRADAAASVIGDFRKPGRIAIKIRRFIEARDLSGGVSAANGRFVSGQGSDPG